MSIMLHVTERMVRNNLSVETSLRLAREAYVKLAKGQITSLERTLLTTRKGLSVYCMPSYVGGGKTVSVKIARLNAENPSRALPSVQASVHVYDSRTGQELAQVQAETLTEMRTAASSAVATDLLAPKHVEILGVFGTGRQARAHIRGIIHVRKVSQVLVYSRSKTRRERFAKEAASKNDVDVTSLAEPERVVKSSDVLVLATNSTKPLFSGRITPPGTHVNAIGAASIGAREVDTELVRRSLIVVDSRAQAFSSYGDIAIPLRQGAIQKSRVRELGELLLLPEKLNRSKEAVTLFKAGGIAALDGTAVEYLISKLL